MTITRRKLPHKYEAISLNLREFLVSTERQLITQALNSAGGNIAAAAKSLQVPRGTLLSKIERFEIKINKDCIIKEGGDTDAT